MTKIENFLCYFENTHFYFYFYAILIESRKKNNRLAVKKMNTTITPFIKWIGGKNQPLEEIRKKYPETISRYCEPFVGSGAVLLDVLIHFKPEAVLINDNNPELINTYIQLRDHIKTVVPMLGNMQDQFLSLRGTERKTYYYSKRNRFNELIQKNVFSEEKAALFIFLNKTAFNGLYRVNSQGLFNAPPGKTKFPVICDVEQLKAISKMLKRVAIQCGDYQECTDFIDQNTLVYIDPPATETLYKEEQMRLISFIEQIAEKEANVLINRSGTILQIK